MRALVNHIIKNFGLFSIGILLDIFQSFEILLEELLLIALELFG